MIKKNDNGIFAKEKMAIMPLPVFMAACILSSLLIKVINNFPKALSIHMGES